jgi:hypothetical protein
LDDATSAHIRWFGRETTRGGLDDDVPLLLKPSTSAEALRLSVGFSGIIPPFDGEGSTTDGTSAEEEGTLAILQKVVCVGGMLAKEVFTFAVRIKTRKKQQSRESP